MDFLHSQKSINDASRPEEYSQPSYQSRTIYAPRLQVFNYIEGGATPAMAFTPDYPHRQANYAASQVLSNAK